MTSLSFEDGVFAIQKDKALRSYQNWAKEQVFLFIALHK